MESNQAFELIGAALGEELGKQGFGPAQPLDFPGGRAEMYATEDVAYALRWSREKKQFELCSTTLTDEGEPGDWRSLSSWLFDEATAERADAESICNDFTDVVQGPKRVAAVVEKQKRKKSRDEDRSVDPLFFVNRLVGIFPELKDPLTEEKIVYGQVRAVSFVREKALPLIDDLARRYPESEPAKKLCALFDDMYKNGDLDTRSIVTHGLFNALEDPAYQALYDQVGEELQKDLKYVRKLRGRNIKPEKPKKKGKKVDVRLGDS